MENNKKEKNIQGNVIPISAINKLNIDKIYEEIFKLKEEKRKNDDQIFTPTFSIIRSFDPNIPGIPFDQVIGGVFIAVISSGFFVVFILFLILFN